MQTLANVARKVVQWDRESLPHGGYRLLNVRTAANDQLPDLTPYTDCTSDEQFADELGTAHRIMGLTASGFWLGMVLITGRFAHVVAMLVD